MAPGTPEVCASARTGLRAGALASAPISRIHAKTAEGCVVFVWVRGRVGGDGVALSGHSGRLCVCVCVSVCCADGIYSSPSAKHLTLASDINTD